MSLNATPVRISRGFADVAEGQVHYRTAGQAHGGPPLIMLHPSPGSAKMLEPLLGAVGQRRWVLATDTLGNGDSSAPRHGEQPPIAYFADAHLRALDALGVGSFDLYGSHTGANIACEIAIAQPHRVRRLILDGVSLYEPEEQAEMLANYAPGVTIDLHGSQLNWIWHFVRDVYLFWPWYRRDAAHRRNLGLPSADELHDKVVEVLKAARTYHVPYRAAIAYDKVARLPLVRVPTLMACARTDMFLTYFDRVKDLIPGSESMITPGTGGAEALAETVGRFAEFLDRTP
ncbi:alpha/beta fold hydrolase [Pararoseomonas sp. SCSIO 73927]|uniref:alpha/beta fold hydrolase n=1 Tax=Pararoseomonas sp. SCSIO 73927 TaxID=3114537 RepID=UPI0030CD59AA